MKSQRFIDAEQDFTETLRLHRKAKNALINRALVRMELSDFEAAIEDLTYAIDQGQQQSLIYLLRSQAWKKLGKHDQSKHDLETGKKLTPTSFDGWIQRGLAFRSTDPQQALRDLNSALTLRPNSKKALQNKVALLSTLQRNEEALATLSKLVQQFPEDATFVFGRGLLKARLGMRDSAIQDGKRGLGISSSPGNQYSMARILAQTSNQEPTDAQLAVTHLQTALRRQPQLIRYIRRDPDIEPVLEQPAIKSLLSPAPIASSKASDSREQILEQMLSVD